MAGGAQWKANPHFAEYDQARENIVLSAARIIEKSGIEKLRLDEVARQAGCARPTLYRYFNSKTELITAVLLYYTMLNAEEVVQHIEQFDDASTRIVEIIYYGSQNLRRNPRFKMFLEARNSKDFAKLAVASIPGLLENTLDEEMLAVFEETFPHNPGVSRKEVFTWIAMQVYALADYSVFENAEEEKAFIRKLMVPGIIGYQHSPS